MSALRAATAVSRSKAECRQWAVCGAADWLELSGRCDAENGREEPKLTDAASDINARFLQPDNPLQTQGLVWL